VSGTALGVAGSLGLVAATGVVAVGLVERGSVSVGLAEIVADASLEVEADVVEEEAAELDDEDSVVEADTEGTETEADVGTGAGVALAGVTSTAG
jgi:hypothetical protein